MGSVDSPNICRHYKRLKKKRLHKRFRRVECMLGSKESESKVRNVKLKKPESREENVKLEESGIRKLIRKQLKVVGLALPHDPHVYQTDFFLEQHNVALTVFKLLNQ